MATNRQLKANQENAQKSIGVPRDTTLSRFNALEHGLLSQGVTELDDPDFYRSILEKLRGELQPQGELESFLVERIALCVIRVRRSALLESEAITAALHPARWGKSKSDSEMESLIEKLGGSTKLVDPGFQARLDSDAVDKLSGTFGRYESHHERRLFRAVAELERLQGLRKTTDYGSPRNTRSNGGR